MWINLSYFYMDKMALQLLQKLDAFSSVGVNIIVIASLINDSGWREREKERESNPMQSSTSTTPSDNTRQSESLKCNDALKHDQSLLCFSSDNMHIQRAIYRQPAVV